jgi:hypothetical protein
MPRRRSFSSLRTAHERAAYGRAMQAHTYLLQSQEKPDEFPPLTLGELAKKHGTTPGTLHRYLGSSIHRTPDGEWEPARRDTLVKLMTVITDDGPIENVPVRGTRDRSLVATHNARIAAFADTGDPRYLRDLPRVTVTDANGRRHRLATDERRIRELIRAGQTKGVQPY